MTTGQTLALTAGGVLLYTMLTKKAALGTLNFYPASVRNIHFDGPTPVMTIGLAVQNTSNQKFVIRALAGSLTANGYQVGNLSFFNTQTVEPRSQMTLMLDIRLSFIGIVNDIIRAFQTNSFSQDLKLSGTVNIDNYQVPLSLNYKVGL